MTYHEKLIEEARRSVLTMDYERAYQGGLVGRLADALEAAEKAHTSTDDEREALRELLGPILYLPISVIRDNILAAGFRRPEVPEPSAEDDLNAEYDARLGDGDRDDPEPQGEPSDAQVLAALDAFFQGQSSNLSEFGAVSVKGMRAALRAAGEVRS